MEDEEGGEVDIEELLRQQVRFPKKNIPNSHNPPTQKASGQADVGLFYTVCFAHSPRQGFQTRSCLTETFSLTCTHIAD